MKITNPWGKTNDGHNHHLAHHCADVAACFEAIANLPTVRDRMDRSAGKPLSAVQLARLSVLAFLHDAGKLHPGFQAKGWHQGIWRGGKHGHVQEGAAIFFGDAPKDISCALLHKELDTWGGLELLLSALAHHGRPFIMENRASKEWSKVASVGYDPVLSAGEIGALIRKWFSPAFELQSGETLPTAPDFQHLFCGLISLADWIGSTKQIFDFVPDLDPHYIGKAREKAAQAVINIGLNVRQFREAAIGRSDFETLTSGKNPRPQQRLIGECPVEERLVILEAETGSGKTEAALWRFAQLFEAGLVDSLYFALPTRAAAVQLHRRVNEVMERLFNEVGPEPVLVVPGYLRSGRAGGRRLPGWEVHWDDDDGLDEMRMLSRWAAESDKRSLASTVAVGTIDQAMLAGLQVKHAHLRAAALSRSFIVIDEVHASDRYMTEIQNHLLKTHLGRGGFAMLMSATLGSVARAKWLGNEQPPEFNEAVKAPYPAVWSRGESAPRACGPQELQKYVQMGLVSTMAAEAVADIAVKAAKDGARVLVIRNTVTTAIKTFEAALQQDEPLLLRVAGVPSLHHSRFAAEDRALLDQAVEVALSPYGRKPSGVIVIGTQTLEQSLDIDADLLITDLCPIDVLLQRIGRLHRHAIERTKGYELPRCHVLTPDQGLARLLGPAFENGLGSWKGPGGFNGIYQDVSGLELTRRLVETHQVWIIPSMNRLLVESATHPARIEAINQELGVEWGNYWNNVYGKNIADAMAAHNIALRTDDPFSEIKFPEANEEKIRTRLGTEGARIKFEEAVVGPFGNKITEISLPNHWSYGVDSRERVVTTPVGDGLKFKTGYVEFFYGRVGVIKSK